jgi:hypothetical protein
VTVAVTTFVATVAVPMVAFVAVVAFAASVAMTTFVATVAVVTFAVIVPVVTFVPMVGRFLFVTRRFLFVAGRFFLGMATTAAIAHAVFAVVVLMEARATTVTTAEGEVAAAGDRDGTAGTDAEHRSRKDCRHT